MSDQSIDDSVGTELCDDSGAFESLMPVDTASVANPVIIEQAKGMLMMIYAIDADRAFELLERRSQTGNVKLRNLARQLIDEFPTLTDDERLPTRAGYDHVLRTACRRIPVAPN